MQIYLPVGARKPGSKFHPRHFLALAEATGQPAVTLTEDLSEVRSGQATIAIRGPGTNCISRAAIANRPTERLVFDQLEQDELAALRSGRSKLLIDFGWEYLSPRPDLVAGLKDALSEFSLDPGRVLLLHSNLAAHEALDRAWQDVSSQPAPRSLAFPAALALVTFFQETHGPDITERLSKARARVDRAAKSRLFTCFNGEGRPHRFYFLAALASRGILDRGYVSMLGYRKRVGEADRSSLDLVQKVLSIAGDREALQPHLAALIARLPLILDIEAVSAGDVEALAWTSQNPELYDDSWLSIVLDSAFFENDMLFITEKAMKPIMNCTPFIYLGNRGGAKALRDLEIRTFEPLVLQPDHPIPQNRVWEAVDGIDKLARIDGPSLQDFARQAWPETEANFLHFRTRLPDLLRDVFRERVLMPIGA